MAFSYGAFDSGLPTAGGFGNVGYGQGPGRGNARAYAAPSGGAGGALAGRAEEDRARMLELARMMPYSPGVIAGQVSQATDQAEAARKAEVERAAAAFGSAGLGQGGGLLSAQDAAARYAQAQGQAARTDIQGRAALANWEALQRELDLLGKTEYQEEGPSPDLGFGGGGIGGGVGATRIFGRKTPGSYGMPMGARLQSPRYAAGPGQTTPKSSWQQFEDRKRAQAEARRQQIARRKGARQKPGWRAPMAPGTSGRPIVLKNR